MARSSILLWHMLCGCLVHEVQVWDDAGVYLGKDFASREDAENILRSAIRNGQRNTAHPDFERQPAARVCAEHTALGHTNNRNHYNTVREEILRHSATFNLAKAERSTLLPEDVRYSFDPVTRALVFFVPTLTATQRSRLQTAVNTRFGVGKVIVNA